VAKQVYRPDIYLEAAQSLVDEGLADAADFPFDTDGFKEPVDTLIDGIPYDGRFPNAYIDSFPIGLTGEQLVIDGEVQG